MPPPAPEAPAAAPQPAPPIFLPPGTVYNPNEVLHQLLPTNVAPEIQTPAAFATAYNTPISITGIVVSDTNDTLLTVTLQGGSTLNVTAGAPGGLGAGSITGNGSALVTLQGDVDEINATLAAGVNFTNARGGSGAQTLTVTATDPQHAAVSGAVTINVGADAAPVLGGVNAAMTVTENDPATVIDASVTLADADSVHFGGGNVTVTSTGVSADVLGVQSDALAVGAVRVVAGTSMQYSMDGLSWTTIGTITSNGAAGTNLVIGLNASADIAAVKALVEHITYTNSSDNPAASRTLNITVNDGEGATSAAQAVSVNVTAVNDPVAVGTAIAGQGATAGSAFSFAFSAGAFADPDSTLTFTATKSDNTALPAWLSFDSSTRTFSGTPAFGDIGTLNVKVVADDGTFNASQTFAITTGNNLSTVNLTQTETYTEDTVKNLTDIVVSGPAPTVTATLTLSSAAAGALSTGTSGAVTSTYNAGTGVWSASGAKADVNALLAAVTFTPAADKNTNVTITTQVTDGIDTVSGSIGLTGTAVNDAPSLVTPLLSQGIGQPQSLSYVVPGGTFTDADIATNADSLTYSAEIYNSGTSAWEALPAWLSFNAATREFTIAAGAGVVGSYVVRVGATDAGIGGAPLTTYANFALGVADNTYTLTTGNDNFTLPVTAGSVIVALTGNDVVYGNTGSDTIYGGAGNEYIQSRDGNDLIYGGDIGDYIYGEGGNDTIYGEAGNDNGALYGGLGNDLVDGGTGDDVLYGNGGTPSTAGDGDDTLLGDVGNDRAYGESGNDSVSGGAGNDSLWGNAGADSLSGGDGNDVLEAGTESDTLSGGAGNDQFAYFNTAESTTTSTDIITDFEKGKDKIIAPGFLDIAVGAPSGTTLGMTFDGTHTVITGTVNNFQLKLLGDYTAGANLLAASDFIFATIFGDGTDNTIAGTAGVDAIDGQAGNDSLTAGGGNDVLLGGDGDDTLVGQANGDLYVGGLGADYFKITNLFDSFNSEGDRIVDFNQGQGDKIVFENCGIDGVVAGSWNNSNIGFSYSAGTNTTTLSISMVSWTFNLYVTGNVAFTAADFIFTNNSQGTAGNDSLTGTAAADGIVGGAGDDTIDARQGGQDVVNAGTGNDLIYGNDATVGNYIMMAGDGNDTLIGGNATSVRIDMGNGDDSLVSGAGAFNTGGMGAGNDTFQGSAANTTVDGSSGNDSLAGGTGNENLFGSDGNDTISGGDGNDVIRGYYHSDSLTGGAGNDTFYCNGIWLEGLKFVYSTQEEWITDFTPGSDKIVLGQLGFEGISAAPAAGTMLTFYYDAGLNQTILTDESQDFVWRFTGNVALSSADFTFTNNLGGTAGNDSINGSSGHDALMGGAGNDTLVTWSNYDVAHGGDGNDLVQVSVAGGSTMVLYGDAGDDTVIGHNGNADALGGGTGADSLSGQTGSDTITGNAGTDTMNGGASADSFRFVSVTDSGTGDGNRDLIVDFTKAQSDKLDLSRIDGTGGLPASFTFLGTSAFTGGGTTGMEVRYDIDVPGNRTLVYVDVGTGAGHDFEIELTGQITLVGGDFVL
ncbi:MAG: putative Ig domain-containing protein [Alphaproteobacteria bacterium]|nr:putative Ig domain-containing protein [Alphaproteobacteria bacterium]